MNLTALPLSPLKNARATEAPPSAKMPAPELRQPHDAIREADRYGREIRDLLPGLELPDVNVIHRKREAILRASEKVIRTAEEPVRIGVVGEFGAGKSLLLGTLVGRPDLLPVSEIPTTGNVTALHLKQADEGKTGTQVGELLIEYLDRPGVHECYEHLLQEGERLFRAAGLEARRVAEFSQLDIDAQDFRQSIIEACRVCWDATHDPAIRHFLKELLDFTRADLALGRKLYGRRVSVAHTLAQNGLQLPRLAGDISSLRFDALASSPVGTFGDSPSEEELRESFFLVKRCTLTVRVPRTAWDLQSDFVLLDFPGLGSGTSGVRDRYLCQRELQDVQTILVLLNGQRPGAGGVHAFYQMMKEASQDDLEDRFLMAISRFDQLPVDEPAARFLQAAAGQDSLTDKDIYEHVPALDSLVQGAQAFTKHHHRILFLSPVHGMRKGAAHEGFATDENGDSTTSPSIAQWQGLADSLATTSPLRRWLEEFTDDGSLRALRSVLEKHAAEHGIRQLRQRASHLAIELSREVEELCLLMERHAKHVDHERPRDKILHALNRLVGQFASLSHRLREEARELKVDDVFLHELIHQRAVIEVGKWTEWNLLLNSSEDSLISPPRRKNRSLLANKQRDNANIPTSSGDFEVSYLGSCHRLSEFTAIKTREALEQWMREFAAAVDESELTRELQEAVSLARPTADPNQANGLEILQIALDLKQKDLTDRLLEECQALENAISEDERRERWRSHFPMAFDRPLAWSADLAAETQKQARHQIHLRQYNQQFVEALSRQFSEICGRMNATAIDALMDTFIDLSGEIRRLSEDRGFIGFLSGEPTEAGDESVAGGTPQGAAGQLRQIASPNV